MKRRKRKSIPLPDEVEAAYGELIEGEAFEQFGADWMDLVRAAFEAGYRLGLKAPAPRLLEFGEKTK